MNTRHIVKAIVLSSDGEMLMLRRSESDVRRPLQWDLPGGYRDPGESLEACMAREVAEEAGLVVQEPLLIYAKTEIREWVDQKTGAQVENVVFLFYRTHVDSKKVTLSHEHSEFQWAKPKEAVQQFEYPLHQEVLQHVIDNGLVAS